MTDTVGSIQQLTIDNKDILNPKLMAPRCKALHARYFNLLKRTKGMVGYDKIKYFDEIIAELEAMGVEFEYICRM